MNDLPAMQSLDVSYTSDQHKKYLEDSYDLLRKSCQVTILNVEQYEGTIFNALQINPVINSRGKSALKNLLQVERSGSFFYVIQFEDDCNFIYRARGGVQNFGVEYYIWAVAKIENNPFGAVSAEPKLFKENSISGLLNVFRDHATVDLERQLDGRYHIELSNAQHGASFFTDSIIRTFNETHNMHLRISNDYLVLGFYDQQATATNLILRIFENLNTRLLNISDWS
jgi:hypothetical protein